MEMQEDAVPFQLCLWLLSLPEGLVPVLDRARVQDTLVRAAHLPFRPPLQVCLCLFYDSLKSQKNKQEKRVFLLDHM